MTDYPQKRLFFIVNDCKCSECSERSILGKKLSSMLLKSKILQRVHILKCIKKPHIRLLT